MNLGVLCYFKYRGFFLNELHDVARAASATTRATASSTSLAIIIPFGISFYTFEAISYTVDVYRRKIAAEKSLPHFLLFILFFPHLVAGPIVRAGDFLPQTRRPKRWNWVRVQVGVQLFLMGCVQEAGHRRPHGRVLRPGLHEPGAVQHRRVLARGARLRASASTATSPATPTWRVGLAHLLGYKLTKNFNMPYLAANITEFWRRWHISLSTWLRDYLFIPLGGSRGVAVADVPQPDDHDDARRAVARGRVGLRPVGRRARADAGRPQAVQGLLRGPAAARRGAADTSSAPRCASSSRSSASACAGCCSSRTSPRRWRCSSSCSRSTAGCRCR